MAMIQKLKQIPLTVLLAAVYLVIVLGVLATIYPYGILTLALMCGLVASILRVISYIVDES